MRLRRALLRTLDIDLASLGLLFIALPLYVTYWMILWINDEDTYFIIDYHKRVGLNGNRFKVRKFRLAPSGAARGFARWIRKYGLDESAQFYNVHVGEMSFVGPRPLDVVDHERSLARVPGWIGRCAVRPGLMGLATTRLPYPKSINYRKLALRLDLRYISHQSLRLNLYVIWVTTKNFWKGHDHRPPEDLAT